MKLHITVLALIACILKTQAMDHFSSLPEEVIPCIFKQVTLTLEESESFRETPYILQIPKKLQILAPLRLVHKPWSNLLTIPNMLDCSGLSTEELVRWQCHHAVEKNRETGNDLKVSFTAMGYLILQNIVNPNMSITIRSIEYLNPKKDERIGITKLTPNTGKLIQIPLLHYALRCNTHPSFIALLICTGAKVAHDTCHPYVRTPLYVAVVFNRIATSTISSYSIEKHTIISSQNVLYLLSMDASFDQKNKAGDTLLHSMAENKTIPSHTKFDLFQDCMLWGANLDLANNAGITARSLVPIVDCPDLMTIKATQLEALRKTKSKMQLLHTDKTKE